MVHSRKLAELILAIAEHPSTTQLGMTKLWKLIYFVDARALREHGKTITGSEFIKYEHGPVPSRGEKVLKTLQREQAASIRRELLGSLSIHRVSALRPHDPEVFSAGERRTIDTVCQEMGGSTATYLSELSHMEPAWSAAQVMDKLDPTLMRYGIHEDPEGL